MAEYIVKALGGRVRDDEGSGAQRDRGAGARPNVCLSISGISTTRRMMVRVGEAHELRQERREGHKHRRLARCAARGWRRNMPCL